MSRNIYRGSAQAFGFDHHSLAAAKATVANPQMYDQYKNFEKTFILMPLMHSEKAEDGESCVAEFTKLVEKNRADGLDKVATSFEGNVKFGKDHLDVIVKFGRYPSRNKALGRETTPEEEEYMKTGARWGQ